MRKKTLRLFGKKLISMTMIIIIIYTILNTLINTKVYAAQVRNTNANNIYNIDENLYPGYASLLQNLKNSHPNWTFTLLYTDLEWTEVLRNETTENHKRSLVQGKTGEWLCTDPQCLGIPHDGTNWFGASQTAVAYYMDPRNFLTEDKIFQFETLSYMPAVHTEAGVEAILKGTFMSNKRLCDYYGNSMYGEKTFAQTIMYAAQVSGASPYHLASRIRQEVGVNGSGSTSGKVAGYEGYFNFYNIGATHGADAVINGLTYAKKPENNWNTPEKSIVAGATWIATNYISKGQDSVYLQKWDVDDQYLGLYWHIYQANIQAPATESSETYKTYKEIFNNDLTYTTFNFIIPMYKNIPKTISRYPSSSTYVSQNAQILDKLGIGVYIRQSPGGTPIGTFSNGYQFLRIELNAGSSGGNSWDKVMLSDGTIGYIATQYVVEVANGNEISKSGYINSKAELYNAPLLPQGGSTSIRLLSTYEKVTIIEEGKYSFYYCPWVKIRLSDGTVGYISGNFVTEGNYGEQVRITCDTELALRETPNGTFIKWMYPGDEVTRIEKATTQVGGFYWDKVITANGTIGYMARERYTPNYLLFLTPINGGTTVTPSGEKVALNETEKVIKVVPGATFADITAKYSGATLTYGGEALGTGAKVSINGVECTVIKLGDLNGDASIDIIDLALMKRHLLGNRLPNDYYRKAGMLQSGTQDIDIVDLALLKRHLLSTQYISLTN